MKTVYRGEARRGRRLAIGSGRIRFLGLMFAMHCAASVSAAAPDVYVDWVGTAATTNLYVAQYVNTGVNAKSGTKAEFEIEFAVVDQDHSVLDVRYDSSNSGRFYLLHLYNRHFSLGYGEFLEIKTHTVQPDTRYRVISTLDVGLQTMIVTNSTQTSTCSPATTTTATTTRARRASTT